MSPTLPRFVRRRLRSQVALLQQAPSLRHTDPRRLAALAAHTDRLSFAPGRTVTKGGEAARELIVVLSGEAVALYPDGHRAEFGPGTELGAAELLDRRPHPVTVVAGDGLEVLVVNGPAVRWAYAEGLAQAMSTTIAASLRRAPEAPRTATAAVTRTAATSRSAA
jgi:CRP-like cAMP-binding protein